MKTSRSKHFKRNLRLFFLSFIISLIAACLMSALIFVYIFAEEKGMGIMLPKISGPLPFPYALLDLRLYLI